MPFAASRAAVGLDSAASTMTGRCKTSSPCCAISFLFGQWLGALMWAVPDRIPDWRRRIHRTIAKVRQQAAARCGLVTPETYDAPGNAGFW